MSVKINRSVYADMFGPTTGDRVRLADTDLIIEVEKDFTVYGEEVKFGERVAALVVEVTDDMTLPKDERRRRQVVDAPKKSPGAKLIKIADKISNVRARISPRPNQDERNDLIDYLAWAEKVVQGCRGVNAMLDRTFDETVDVARSAL